jgi:hypothetical protein
MSTSVEVLQSKFENMSEQMCSLKEDVKCLWTSMAINHKMIMDKFDWLDNKYATKLSVNRIWVIIWSIIGFVFTALWAVSLSTLLK